MNKPVAGSINRLASPAGLLINRERAISFSFEGKTYQGYEGDTIASALLANQQWLMSRSFKYHRPRGPLTMAGHDANTLVQVGGEPNVLADKRAIQDSLVVWGQNYNGSLEKDKDQLLDKLGRFMPVGFYYRSFYKPLGSWKFWEPIIRKKAGLGKLDLNFQPEYYDKKYLFHDLVVVGSGPAGLQAALTAANAGASVLLVEEQAILGGALAYHRFDIKGKQGDSLRTQFVEQVEKHQNIEVLLNATCNGWFTDNYLPIIQGKRMFKARAKQCIVASGAFEQHVVFRNNDLPGIVLCSAASRMMKLYGVKPGEQAVILAGNDQAYLTALELAEHGVVVKAVVDMRDSVDSQVVLNQLQIQNIPVIHKATVYEAQADSSKNHLGAVEIRSLIGEGEVASQGERIECDLLCMSAGFMPCYQLLCQAGASLNYHDGDGAFAITKLPENLQVAGSANGKHELEQVMADGINAAVNAVFALGLRSAQKIIEFKADDKVNVNYSWPIFKHAKGKDFVDFDEDLQAKDIINAARIGYRDVQLAKRYSTVGMGPSQGRHSALPTARLLAKTTDRTVTETGVTTARPPYAPEKIAHVAGRLFDPVRYTPMHDCHLALGAKMMPAGNWQRPAFYGNPSDRDHCMQAESQHVRTKVGVIDVSTLGGLDIRGPDAAEFMQRMFTFAFLKQPVGKTRYAILTNEQGVVIDDGVACRLAEDYFYVTATTSGVEGVYREMLRWNAQWRLDVDIANVTSAFAAINVAGPDSRKVLETIAEDIDLSAEAFPYLAYREGNIAGIPARLLRVGFVGELGFEVHVPAAYGKQLWRTVLAAGEGFDIKPFGVETQRLLRLEKGHIIIGQDTDAMSHPGEVHLSWAVNRKKPFFVGCRSVDIVMARKQTRRLVGFTLPKSATKPQEGHLVLQGDDIAGHVTSCEYSPTVDAIIGMAYVGIDQCEPDAEVPIRVDQGEMVKARVVKLPFYDAENRRQEM